MPSDPAVLRLVQGAELRARDVEEPQIAAPVGFVVVGDRCPIRAWGDVHDRQRLGVAVGMDLTHHSTIARQIPRDDDPVGGGRVQRGRVLHELERRRRGRVAGEALEQLAVRRIPDRDAAVLPSRRDRPAVRSEGDDLDDRAARQCVLHRAGSEVPDGHHVVRAGHDPGSRRVERDRAVGVRDRRQERAGGGIDHEHPGPWAAAVARDHQPVVEREPHLREVEAVLDLPRGGVRDHGGPRSSRTPVFPARGWPRCSRRATGHRGSTRASGRARTPTHRPGRFAGSGEGPLGSPHRSPRRRTGPPGPGWSSSGGRMSSIAKPSPSAVGVAPFQFTGTATDASVGRNVVAS